MNTKRRWRQHLINLVSSGLDPVVYAVRWARDPRCMQHGSNHRRVGHMPDTRAPVCALWSVAPGRSWQ
ncbi:hypothetical protein [Povalibacter sp.]|uniref:hypothetical protein n=1 Tax=Povalibacter sp. TaxID=1962978 RepID=UPI002F401F0B